VHAQVLAVGAVAALAAGAHATRFHAPAHAQVSVASVATEVATLAASGFGGKAGLRVPAGSVLARWLTLTPAPGQL